jgi:phosphocarrier protein HPr
MRCVLGNAASSNSAATMLEADIEIVNKLGLHARAAAKLVALASRYKSTVMINKSGREVNAKSIMGVMMLAAGIGSKIKVKVDGIDEEACLEAVQDIFQRKFDEGQ